MEGVGTTGMANARTFVRSQSIVMLVPVGD
jgi:hypothetical protein